MQLPGGGDQPGPPEQVFARRVRQIRESLGVTQAALALAMEVKLGVKVDPTAITKIEAGSRAIRLNEAQAIADALDQTVDEVLRPALPPEEQVRQAEASIDRARWRAAAAEAEYQVAQARLERLTAAFADQGPE